MPRAVVLIQSAQSREQQGNVSRMCSQIAQQNQSYAIVIIDDDRDVVDLMQRHAEAAGVTSQAFFHVEQVDLDALKHADVIFLDLMLDTHDGLDIVSLMQQHQIQTPVIISSGMDESIQNATQELLHDYGVRCAGKLSKPFKFEQFVERMRAALELCPQEKSATVPSAFVMTQLDVQIGIKSKWLRIAYQPIVNPQTGEMCGIECLARFEHPLYGTCYPNQFLDHINTEALIDAFTRAVFERALDDLCHASLPDSLRIAFNIDPRGINLALFNWLNQTLNAYAVSPQRICLEVTEVAALDLNTEVKTILTKLRIRGFALSLDDFGTGYSTIQELSELPFSEIKIDRIFVANMLEKDTSLAIVKSTIELANQLKYSVVAEGVETAEQFARLAELGCERAQGFFMCRPVDIRALEQYYSSKRSFG